VLYYSENKYIYTFLFVSWVRMSPLFTAATVGLLFQSQMIDDDECEAVGGMRIGRGTEVLKTTCLSVTFSTPNPT
jgi:hypothetical protein